jgi:hypothetical protein
MVGRKGKREKREGRKRGEMLRTLILTNTESNGYLFCFS